MARCFALYSSPTATPRRSTGYFRTPSQAWFIHPDGLLTTEYVYNKRVARCADSFNENIESRSRDVGENPPIEGAIYVKAIKSSDF